MASQEHQRALKSVTTHREEPAGSPLFNEFADLKQVLIKLQQGVGRGYQLRNSINDRTKTGIVAFCQMDDLATAKECLALAIEEQKKLNELAMPPAESVELKGSSAQEIVELAYVIRYWPHIILTNGPALSAIEPPKMKDLPVEPADYVNGICDVPSELWKQVGNYTAQHEILALTPLYLRLEHVAKEIHRLLITFANLPDNVTRNTRRPDFKESFNGKLLRLADTIREITRQRLIQQVSDRQRMTADRQNQAADRMGAMIVKLEKLLPAAA